jgi:uncharacterized delta-60 repeat protein
MKTDANGHEVWTRTFGGAGIDDAYSVQQTSDGGYIVAGSTHSFGAGEQDVYLIKTDTEGDEVWNRTFGGTRYEGASSVQQTADGGYIVGGSKYSLRAGGEDVYLIKTDQNGEGVWSMTFGGTGRDEGNCVQQTSDGGYIVAGFTGSFGAGEYDAYLIKTNQNGEEVWSRTFGGAYWDYAYSVQQTTDGGYILAGFTTVYGVGRDDDVYLIKTNANGEEVWSRTFGGEGLDQAGTVQQTSDGGYIIAGRTESFGAGWDDVYLIKTDADGHEVWSRTFGGIHQDSARSIQQTSDGGYIVAGFTNSFGAGLEDVYLIKTDANGDAVWTKTFGGAMMEGASSVQQTSDGGYIVAGSTFSSGAGLEDVYLIKTDANGDEVWSRTFGGTEYEQALSVQQTCDGGYIVAGLATSFGAQVRDVYLIKTDPNGDEVWSRTFGGAGWNYAYSVQQISDGGYIVAGFTEAFGAGSSDVYLIRTDQNGYAPPPPE